MHTLIIKISKAVKLIRLFLVSKYSAIICKIKFYLNGVTIESFNSYGVPYVNKSLNAKISIGKNFIMNNGVMHSDSGVNGKCRIDVRDNAFLSIGDNVGLSDVTITCHQSITIANNVLVGVGSQIRDTDNHSLDPEHRKVYNLDWKNKKTSPIQIKDNVYIGAYCFILKGVTIGENSIVGACSVVTKDIPCNEIWAGNPAKYIRDIPQK